MNPNNHHMGPNNAYSRVFLLFFLQKEFATCQQKTTRFVDNSIIWVLLSLFHSFSVVIWKIWGVILRCLLLLPSDVCYPFLKNVENRDTNDLVIQTSLKGGKMWNRRMNRLVWRFRRGGVLRWVLYISVTGGGLNLGIQYSADNGSRGGCIAVYVGIQHIAASGSWVVAICVVIFPREGRLWNFGGTHKIHKRFLTESTGSTWVGKEQRDVKERRTQGV